MIIGSVYMAAPSLAVQQLVCCSHHDSHRFWGCPWYLMQCV